MNIQLNFHHRSFLTSCRDANMLAEFNPEDEEFGLESVWRTNLMIEGEEERHNEAVLLCRMTSIEESIQKTIDMKL